MSDAVERSHAVHEGGHGPSGKLEDPNSRQESRHLHDDGVVHDADGAVLTETVRSGITSLHARARDLEAKIDDFMAASGEILDNLKAQFMSRLERIKEELSMFTDDQTGEWTKVSADTKESVERLRTAQQLVQSLGLEAVHMQPHDAPNDI